MTRKTRVWAGIYYPESPDDTPYQAIEDAHVPCVVSPCHDQDAYLPTDKEVKQGKVKAGEKKKAHYHYMWVFPGPSRITQAQDVSQRAFGSKSPLYMEPVSSYVAMTRYFAHIDQPEKHQYDPASIRTFNGASLEISKPLTHEDVQRISTELTVWCRSTGCTEYQDLIDYAMDRGPDYYDVASSHTIYFSHYIGSIRNRTMHQHSMNRTYGVPSAATRLHPVGK